MVTVGAAEVAAAKTSEMVASVGTEGAWPPRDDVKSRSATAGWPAGGAGGGGLPSCWLQALSSARESTEKRFVGEEGLTDTCLEK